MGYLMIWVKEIAVNAQINGKFVNIIIQAHPSSVVIIITYNNMKPFTSDNKINWPFGSDTWIINFKRKKALLINVK